MFVYVSVPKYARKHIVFLLKQPTSWMFAPWRPCRIRHVFISPRDSVTQQVSLDEFFFLLERRWSRRTKLSRRQWRVFVRVHEVCCFPLDVDLLQSAASILHVRPLCLMCQLPRCSFFVFLRTYCSETLKITLSGICLVIFLNACSCQW